MHDASVLVRTRLLLVQRLELGRRSSLPLALVCEQLARELLPLLDLGITLGGEGGNLRYRRGLARTPLLLMSLPSPLLLLGIPLVPPGGPLRTVTAIALKRVVAFTSRGCLRPLASLAG